MKTKSLQATHIFLILAFLLLLGAIFINYKIDNTRDKINNVNYKSNIKHVNNLSNNIKDKILTITGKEIYKSLKSNEDNKIHYQFLTHFLV